MREGLSLAPRQRMKVALVIASAMHAAVIGGVSFSDLAKPARHTHSIEVVFTPVPSEQEPKDAHYVAPLAQVGSGDDQRENVPSDVVQGLEPDAQSGLALMAETDSAAPGASADPAILKQRKSPDSIAVSETRPEANPQPGSDGASSRAAELARLNAELAMEVRRYAQRPRVSFVNAVSAKSSVEASYMKEWVDRVERTGNQHYPDEARRSQLSGTVLMSVWVDSGGNIVRLQVDRHSGQQVLDDSAQRSVQLAAPFPRFSPELARVSDQLVITRTWVFEGGGLRTRTEQTTSGPQPGDAVGATETR